LSIFDKGETLFLDEAADQLPEETMTDIRTAAETMSKAELAFDNPEAYIAGDRRRAPPSAA